MSMCCKGGQAFGLSHCCSDSVSDVGTPLGNSRASLPCSDMERQERPDDSSAAQCVSAICWSKRAQFRKHSANTLLGGEIRRRALSPPETAAKKHFSKVFKGIFGLFDVGVV